MPIKKPITYDGKVFSTQKEFADKLGVTEGRVSQIVEKFGRNLPKDFLKNGQSVTIRGVKYENVSQASLDLGVAKQGIYTARARGRLDHIGLGRWAKS